MEAVQKVDCEFGVGRRSGKHTIRDSSEDIRRMALNLLGKKVTTHRDGRTSPSFRDTTGDGFAKMTPAWLKQALTHSDDTTETPEQQQQQHLQDTEIDYVVHALP